MAEHGECVIDLQNNNGPRFGKLQPKANFLTPQGEIDSYPRGLCEQSPHWRAAYSQAAFANHGADGSRSPPDWEGRRLALVVLELLAL